MPVLITASIWEVGMGLVPEERASARSDEPEARSACVLGTDVEIGGVSPDLEP